MAHDPTHGDKAGLLDDDHPQYSRADGTRDITGPQRFQGNVRIDGQAYQETVHTGLPTGTTYDLDWNNGNIQELDLDSATDDITISYLNPPAGGGTLVLKVIQGVTARNIILPAGSKNSGGTAGSKTLTITATDNAEDLVIITKIGASYYFEHKQNYA